MPFNGPELDRAKAYIANQKLEDVLSMAVNAAIKQSYAG